MNSSFAAAVLLSVLVVGVVIMVVDSLKTQKQM
jgi:hypothetical protein